MTDDLSRELRERLGRVSLPAAPSSLRGEIESLRSIPAATPVRRRSARRPTMMLAAALVTVGLVAAGIGGALLRERNEPRQDLSLIASPSPSTALSRSSSPNPSQLASTSPSPTAVPITWTPASLNEDWPVPVRAEPAGNPTVLPILLNVSQDHDGISSVGELGRFSDPSGDTGSAGFPWVDIDEAVICGPFCIGLMLVSDQPPVVDPTDQWIAYGLVLDDDGDGVPDRRFGIANIPVAAAGEHQGHWQWMTDLHTGRTVAAAAASDSVGGTFLNTFYPPGFRADVDFGFGGAVAGGGSIGDMPERFYGWASVIQHGRVVATDYAPDVGWLEPSPDAKP